MPHSRTRVFNWLLVSGLALLLLACGPSAWAQATSGDVVGTVTDKSGAAVPNADVSAKNNETGVVTAVKANTVGDFHIPNLQGGRYDITASATGFASFTLKGFQVVLNSTSTAKLELGVASAATNVEVSAEATAVLDTTTVQLQTSFETEELKNFPTASVGNGVLNLSLLVPGVASSGAVGAGTGPSVGGQRPRADNYSIEGIDNNNKSVTGPLVYVPNDAVGEFTVLQNVFSAEYGHSNAGQFNQIIKSGTNHFHGVAYEYFQNRNLNAIDASTARAQGNANVVAPRYDDNRFGGQVGGPILRNRLFFFSNYEQQPQGFPGATASFCAPTAAGFTALGNASGVVANNLAVFKKYSPVAASQAGADDPICPSSVTVSGQDVAIGDVGVVSGSYTNNKRSINSLDYTIGAKDSLRARYMYNNSIGLDASATFQSFWAPAPSYFHLFTLSEFHTFSPSLTSEFRLGYNRYYNVTLAPGQFPGMKVFPNITIDDLNGVNIGPDPNGPQGTIQNTYEGSESLIWNKGRHTMKTGFEFRDVISPQQFVQRVRGDYEWSSLEFYLQDLSPDTFGERNATAPGVSPTYYGNQKVAYAYFQDDFHVTRALTLNLGARYELTTVPIGEQQQKANSAASVPGLITFRSPRFRSGTLFLVLDLRIVLMRILSCAADSAWVLTFFTTTSESFPQHRNIRSPRTCRLPEFRDFSLAVASQRM